MAYGQIRFAAGSGTTENSGLAFHWVRDDGRPGCGDPCRPWQGKAATFVPVPDREMRALLPATVGVCGRNGCK